MRFFGKFSKKNYNPQKEDAFTYITALIFVTVIGISLTTGSTYWSTVIAREKEKELLFRGGQIRKAIESYYNGAPGGGSHQYPASLNDLLKDSRYPATRRYLRKIYKDPMTKDGQWVLITAPGGRIKGVFSASKGKPLKAGNFSDDLKNFENAETYSAWRFVYPPELDAAASPTAASKETGEEESFQQNNEPAQEELQQSQGDSGNDEAEPGDEPPESE
jgi:type II secretory pathway pseudopilin PulG